MREFTKDESETCGWIGYTYQGKERILGEAVEGVSYF
jgi:hypothetical protein